MKTFEDFLNSKNENYDGPHPLKNPHDYFVGKKRPASFGRHIVKSNEPIGEPHLGDDIAGDMGGYNADTKSRNLPSNPAKLGDMKDFLAKRKKNESIIDPKNNPSAHYNDDDDDDSYDYRSELGKTAQYPLAHADNLKGFQTSSEKDLFSNKEPKIGRQDFIDTLKSKLYAGEKMSTKEINFLLKNINKDLDSF